MTEQNGDGIDITLVKAAVLTELVNAYRTRGREGVTSMLTDMDENVEAGVGVVPVAVELVVALSGCIGVTRGA